MKKDKGKPEILFYSDCTFFGGCENMLISLFSSSGIREEFELTFVYRYSKQYEKGMRSRLKMKINKISALPVIDDNKKVVGLITAEELM